MECKDGNTVIGIGLMAEHSGTNVSMKTGIRRAHRTWFRNSKVEANGISGRTDRGRGH